MLSSSGKKPTLALPGLKMPLQFGPTSRTERAAQ
jgi:hypothetical protein